MSAQHTPGTAVAQAVNVTLGGTQAKYHAVGIHDTKVAIAITGLVDADDGAINEVNSRRIAACWNACDGISTEHLERHGLPDFAQKISDLVEQRDELRGAAKNALNALQICGIKFEHIEAELRAAIDKTGGAA